MQNNNNNIKFLIIIGLFLILPLNSIIFASIKSINLPNENLNKIRSSAPFSSFNIDDLPGSLTNWSWAETQPWFGGGAGTEIDPYILEDLIVDGNLTDSCISISNSNAFFIIRNCTLLNSSSGISYGGISLTNVSNGIVTDNYFYNHRNAAIYATTSEYNLISENTLENHHHGIYCDGNYNEIVDNSVYGDGSGSGIVIQGNYHNNTVNGNYIEHCWQGMFILNSDNNTFSNNFVFKNFRYGLAFTSTANNNLLSENILLNNSWGGIAIEASTGNTIQDSEIKRNQQHGIYLINGDSTTIYHNRIIENVLDGINIATGSSNNLVYRNFFSGNGRHAYDNGGSSNDWNSTIIGNYWDNHTAPDTSPADGIVDNPYSYIDGGASSIDYLPIAEDGAPMLIINSPLEDGTFGINAPNFDITVIDAFILDMWYSLDGGLTKYFFTTNGTIDQEAWDALPEGSVTLTFYTNDTAGNLTSESINIVKSIPTDNFMVVIIIVVSIISVAAVAVIIFVLMRMRKTSK